MLTSTRKSSASQSLPRRSLYFIRDLSRKLTRTGFLIPLAVKVNRTIYLFLLARKKNTQWKGSRDTLPYATLVAFYTTNDHSNLTIFYVSMIINCWKSVVFMTRNSEKIIFYNWLNSTVLLKNEHSRNFFIALTWKDYQVSHCFCESLSKKSCRKKHNVVPVKKKNLLIVQKVAKVTVSRTRLLDLP